MRRGSGAITRSDSAITYNRRHKRTADAQLANATAVVLYARESAIGGFIRTGLVERIRVGPYGRMRG
jgi:hypothetical protein